jgi:hypothetical protein
MWTVSRHVLAWDVVLMLSVPPRVTVLGLTDNRHAFAAPGAARTRQTPLKMQVVASSRRTRAPFESVGADIPRRDRATDRRRAAHHNRLGMYEEV